MIRLYKLQNKYKCLIKIYFVIVVALVSFSFITLCGCNGIVFEDENNNITNQTINTSPTNTSNSIYNEVLNQYGIVVAFINDGPYLNANYYGTDASAENVTFHCSYFMNYIPKLKSKPTKYLQADVNNDGIDELLISNDRAVLVYYTYNPSTKLINMNTGSIPPSKLDINTLQWNEIKPTDMNKTYSGVLKIQTVKERLEDNNSKGRMVEYVRDSDENFKYSYYNYKTISIDLDNNQNTIIRGADGSIYYRDFSSITLGLDDSRLDDYKFNDVYTKFSYLNNKHITFTLNSLKLISPSQIQLECCDVKDSDPINLIINNVIEFKAEWLTKSPTFYNNQMALMCAEASEKIEDSDESLKTYLQQIGFDTNNCYITYHKHGSVLKDKIYVCSIAHTTINVQGTNQTLVFIICRGSKEASELMGDFHWLLNDNSKPLAGESIYENVYDFEECVYDGLVDYANKHNLNNIDGNKLKVVVCGHSLGGAAANAVTAKMNYEIGLDNWWLHRITMNDIYSYTFGAIKVLGNEYEDSVNKHNGYENIHNIYNWSDSFGPFGSKQILRVSCPYKKFGHTETFDIDKHDSDDIDDGRFTESHDMPTYIEALNKEERKERENSHYLELTCDDNKDLFTQILEMFNFK